LEVLPVLNPYLLDDRLRLPHPARVEEENRVLLQNDQRQDGAYDYSDRINIGYDLPILEELA
jgi:hypothetical protein